MPFNKGTLDAYSTINTKYLEARTLTLTGSANIGGNLWVTGSISGSSYLNVSGDIDVGDNLNVVTLSGSSHISGSLITATSLGAGTISGSTYLGNLVTGLCGSGSSAIVGDITLTGSASNVKITQTGSVIYIGTDCPTVANGSFNHTNVTTEETMLEIVPTTITHLHGIWFDLANLTMTGSIKVYNKIDGTNYRILPNMTLVVSGSSQFQGIVMKDIWINTDLKFTIQSSYLEGATRAIPYRYFMEEY